MSQISTPISYYYTRWIFLRVLATIYFIAFASLSVQIIGLVGEKGVLPVHDFLNQIQSFQLLPTIFWFNCSDTALIVVCIAGMLFSLLAFFGIASVAGFAIVWFLYLSLVNIGQDFLSFQWDILLLETGFLAIFLAPWQWLEWRQPIKIQAPVIIIWLLRLLLFRLMFESAFVKLASGDPTWHNLTALNYHYFTQPLPTPPAWYAAQLPDWFNQFSVVMVFVIELLMPFLIFFGRKVRLIAFGSFVFLQTLIALTGNYAFFNLLTVALCICLLDDSWIVAVLKRARIYVLDSAAPVRHHSDASRPLSLRPYKLFVNSRALDSTAAFEETVGAAFMRPSDDVDEPALNRSCPMPKAQRAVTIAIAVLIGFLSILVTARGIFGIPLPEIAENLHEISSRYFICNTYGLFAIMTTKRLEIEIEGSKDGIFWDAYEFKYKPGDLSHAPCVVAPHQPRLDWQMWFAALSDLRNNPWLVNLAVRLLQGEPTVLKLLAKNPFPNSPPAYIRAKIYDYRFTNEAERKQTSNWWKRELVGDYLPVLTIQNQ